MGHIVSIVYKPKEAALAEDGYTRLPLNEANLVADYGIEGDAKGGSRNRQVNIMTFETMTALEGEGFQTRPGALGEQIVVSGVDVDALAPGAKLRLGDSACLEIVEPRTGCAKFERYQEKSPKLVAGRIGMMARVTEGGTIRVGDSVAPVE